MTLTLPISRYRLLFENSRDIILFVRLSDGRILEANPAAEQAYGYTRAELLALSIHDLRAPQTHPEIASQMQQASSNGILFETLHIAKDGSVFPVEVSSQGTEIDGEPVNLSIIRDIRERISSQGKIRDLARFPGENPNPVFRVDRGGVLLYANPSCMPLLEFWGYQVGQTLKPRHCQAIRMLLEGDRTREREIHLGGRTFLLLLTPIPEAGYVNGYGLDVTRARAAEAALREGEEKFRTLIEQSSEGVVLLDEQGQVIEWNQAQEQITGISCREALGRPVWDLQIQIALPERRTPESFASAREILSKALQTGESPTFLRPYETVIQRRDGTRLHILQTSFPIKTRRGFRVGSIVQDITPRKQAEAELTRRIRELEFLAQISGTARAAGARDALLPAALEQLATVFNTQGAILAFPDPQSGDFVIERGQGEWVPAAGVRIPAGKGVGGLVAASQQSYLNNDVQSDGQLIQHELGRRTKCLICVALIADQRTVALLYLGRQAAFASSDILLAEAAGDMIASALKRIELHQQTEKQLERLTALRAIDLSILNNLNLDDTLEVLLEKITQLLQVDAANILLYNESMQTLRSAGCRGMVSPSRWYETLNLGESHAGKAAQTLQMDLVPDLGQIDDGLTAHIRRAGEQFVGYAGVPLLAKGQLKGVLQLFHRQRLAPDADWLNFLQALAGQAAIAIDSAQLFKGLQETNQRLVQSYDRTIEGWSRALDLRDKETEGHCQRVTELTLALARRLGVNEADLVHYQRGALLHDIGKMAIPDNILFKPGKLSDEEWAIMRQHPVHAVNLLYPIEFLSSALEIPFSHHEKWDGSGYPQGLAGEEIPLAARIFAVIDVWDALCSDRPYRPAWSRGEALAYIQEQSGIHFDPRIVKEFLEMVGESK